MRALLELPVSGCRGNSLHIAHHHSCVALDILRRNHKRTFNGNTGSQTRIVNPFHGIYPWVKRENRLFDGGSDVGKMEFDVSGRIWVIYEVKHRYYATRNNRHKLYGTNTGTRRPREEAKNVISIIRRPCGAVAEPVCFCFILCVPYEIPSLISWKQQRIMDLRVVSRSESHNKSFELIHGRKAQN